MGLVQVNHGLTALRRVEVGEELHGLGAGRFAAFRAGNGGVVGKMGLVVARERLAGDTECF